MGNITGIIKSIRDIVRKDTGVDGDAQRISQMVWMLFMKIFADKEEEWEITIKGYKSPIPNKLKWQNWAANAEGLTGEAQTPPDKQNDLNLTLSLLVII